MKFLPILTLSTPCLLQKFQGWCLQWKEVLVLTTTIFILLKLELYMFDLNTNNNNNIHLHQRSD